MIKTGYDNKMLFQKGDRHFTKVRFNSAFHGFKKGQTVNIEVDSEGTPLKREMRNRFRDSERDNCITILKSDVDLPDATAAGRAKKKKEG